MQLSIRLSPKLFADLTVLPTPSTNKGVISPCSLRRGKCILIMRYLLDFTGIFHYYSDDIKSNIALLMMVFNIRIGCHGHKTALLLVYRLFRLTTNSGCTRFDFNENYLLFVGRNDIYLQFSETPVSLKNLVLFLLQKLHGALLAEMSDIIV